VPLLRQVRFAPTMKRFRFGWYGDGGLGERLIQAILTGRKTATACPAYDPEDADLKAGDDDEPSAVVAVLVHEGEFVAVELRSFGSFDEALAEKEGVTLAELREKMNFANGRQVRDDEEMRVVHFRVASKPRP
jgi:uncharacterized protein YhfF